MNIEVTHNPDRLPARARVRVRSVRRAYKLLEATMAERRPRGLRIRHACDVATNIITMEARHSTPITFMLNVLEKAGFVESVSRGYC